MEYPEWQASVIIPAFNCATTLARAVHSALEQRPYVLEVLIVENCSTDLTLEVAQALAQQNERVRVLHQARRGASAARNLGTQTARCEWLQYLDADDELLPGKLARQRTLTLDSVQWVMGTYIWRDSEGAEVVVRPAEDPFRAYVHKGGVGHVNASLFRRSTVLAVGGWPEWLENGVDMELYLNLLTAGTRWTHDCRPGSIYHDYGSEQLSQRRPGPLKLEETDRKARLAQYLKTNQPEYYRANEAHFRTAILRGIRQIFTYDPALGRKAYRDYFPNGLDFSSLDENLLPNYYSVYRFLPFELVETWRSRLGKVWRTGRRNISTL